MVVFWLKVISQWTGHSEIQGFKRMRDLIDFMHRPVDAASLGLCRILFGIVMLIDIAEERGGAIITEKWSDPMKCHFPIFEWIQPMNVHRMCCVYLAMWLGALGITIGFMYRVSSATFALSYWYVFLLDRSVWNNHSYLFGLCAILFANVEASRFCSVDAFLGKWTRETVPFWNYFIIKYQFYILYFVAGLKKMNSEWLSGYAMANLSYHWVFTPFRYVMGYDLTDLLIIHWFGWLFDLTIMFWLIFESTRRFALIPCIAFHLMNAAIFRIGMFPWLCIVQLPLFFRMDWPRTLFKTELQTNELIAQKTQNTKKSTNNTTIYLVMIYCAVQAILPFTHRLTPGYNTWTDGPYGYSWDMMVHAWDTVQVTTKVRDNNNGNIVYVDDQKYVDSDRWNKHADMAHQFAKCLAEKLEFGQTDLKPKNISIYFDVWCSLNGRFQQRIYHPDTDMLMADWSPWKHTPWILPLLGNLTTYREEIFGAKHKNNQTNKLYVADFPGLTMEHFISDQLENVSMTVIEGAVKHETDQSDSIIWNAGSEFQLNVGMFHKIETIGIKPSCYVYTYQNKTDSNYDHLIIPVNWSASIHNIIQTRFNNYQQFLTNVITCLLQ